MNDQTKQNDEIFNEAVVAIFDTPEDASRVSASMRLAGRRVVKVSMTESASKSEMPQLVYDEIEEVGPADVVNGSLKCAAIGAATGLAAIAVPGLNVLAPLAGGAAGAFIGSIAGVDETRRAIRLPNESDYYEALLQGRSVVAMFGNERERIEFAAEMKKLGAKELYQHPPVHHVVHKPTA